MLDAELLERITVIRSGLGRDLPISPSGHGWVPLRVVVEGLIPVPGRCGG